jgi:hypothetical protein
MKQSIKLSQGEKNIVIALRGCTVLCVSKTETKANLAFSDTYSFYKNINHWEFDTLNQKGLLKKIDSRVVSNIYELSELGKSIDIS